MEGGQEQLAVLGDVLAVDLGDLQLGVDQEVQAEAPEGDDDFRRDRDQLRHQEMAALLDLLGQRIAVVGWAALEHVADEHVILAPADLADSAPEQLPRAADEGTPLLILIPAGCFTNKGDASTDRAFSGDSFVSRFMQSAGGAGANLSGDAFQELARGGDHSDSVAGVNREVAVVEGRSERGSTAISSCQTYNLVMPNHSRYSYWLVALTAAALLAVWLPACNDTGTSSDEDTTAIRPPAEAGGESVPEPVVELTSPPPEAATIAYIGNFRGFHRPCNCTTKQDGGLPRLGSAVSALGDWLSAAGDETAETPKLLSKAPALSTPQPLWIIDLGNFSNPGARYPVMKARTHLAALAMLTSSGCRAVVPGSSELQLDIGAAEEILADSPVPLVSCNLQCELENVEIEPYVQLATGWYLVGVSSWVPAVGDPPDNRWWALTEPVESVQRVLETLPADARVIVAAQYQPGAVVRELAALPVVAVLGYGAAEDPRWSDELAPAFPIPPEKGQRLILASLGSSADGADDAIGWELSLGEDWPDDEQINELLASEQEKTREQARADLDVADTQGWRDVDWSSSKRYLPPSPEQVLRGYLRRDPEYVGSEECSECHPDATETWRDSRHSSALVSLTEKLEQQTIDCLECHVVGLLTASGYNPFAPASELGAVGCESCHGPASLHVARMSLDVEADEVAIERPVMDVCTLCHDSYNSPSFEREGYWRKIKH